jgi:SAM-dependent methyltransferase
MFTPAVLGPAVDRLEALAGDGPVLEFAIGTGRVALPLAARDIEVKGIELSAAMVDQLRAKPGGDALPVTIGNMVDTRIDGEFSLVYVAWNSLKNVTTQAEQVDTFRNAAAHLAPGGRFVVELGIPQIPLPPARAQGVVFDLSQHHVGIDTYDVANQILWSHHWRDIDGHLTRHSAPYRYVWPAELDLMGQLAGLPLEHRWGSWTMEDFTNDSRWQIAVFRKPA